MQKLCLLALVGASSAAFAQTPAPNLMPDGSRDMYVGIGATSTPIYEGALDRRFKPLLALQVQWSNGVFISGQSVGMHLSTQPSLEFGPLVSLAARRTPSGVSSSVVEALGATASGSTSSVSLAPPDQIVPPTIIPDPVGPVPPGPSPVPPLRITRDPLPGTTRLTGLEEIRPRIEVGGFANFYITPALRLTNSLLYGAGNARKGLRWNVDLQSIAAELAPHHTVVLSIGMTVVNSHYNQAYFGVSPSESLRSVNAAYTASGGVKDLHAAARWNWALGPSWLLTSGVTVSRLTGSAANSPLVDRPSNISASSVLAYRF